MQALFMTVGLRERLLKLTEDTLIRATPSDELDKEEKKIDNEEEDMAGDKSYDILHETEYLFQELTTSKERLVVPRKFKQSLPSIFRYAYEEQDASEFLQIYLDCLETELEKTEAKVRVCYVHFINGLGSYKGAI